MMRMAINLASEPFRRDRPYLVVSAALSILLALSLVVLVFLAWQGRDEAVQARLELEKARAQLQALAAEQARLQAVLGRAENAAVIERNVFLNLLLVRKGISWTRIFSDLEKVMPYNVKLIQVRPQVQQENQIYLDMVLGAQSPEPIIEMLMKLESSEQFGATLVSSWLPPTQNEPLYRYRVTVNYAQKL